MIISWIPNKKIKTNINNYRHGSKGKIILVNKNKTFKNQAIRVANNISSKLKNFVKFRFL